MMDEKLIKRIVSLAFAAVYTVKHGNTRAGALRVASHAYRFLDGEPVDQINREADLADTIREKGTTQPKKRKFPWKVQINAIRRLTKYGHRSHSHRAAGSDEQHPSPEPR